MDSPFDYKDKLKRFNSTTKYLSEVYFLFRLLDPAKGEIILDYGCGRGACLQFLKSHSNAEFYGYDINVYVEGTLPEWFITDLQGEFDKIFFFHSFAHISNVKTVLSRVRGLLRNKSKLVIITPNKHFDDYYKELERERHYSPDETVVAHYSAIELKTLVENEGFTIDLIGQFGNTVADNIHERVFLEATKVEDEQ